jgi:hypothetical protein
MSTFRRYHESFEDALTRLVTTVMLRINKYACCFYPLSIFKSTPTSNGEGMDRK